VELAFVRKLKGAGEVLTTFFRKQNKYQMNAKNFGIAEARTSSQMLTQIS
jgi:hypothetical protein